MRMYIHSQSPLPLLQRLDEFVFKTKTDKRNTRYPRIAETRRVLYDNMLGSTESRVVLVNRRLCYVMGKLGEDHVVQVRIWVGGLVPPLSEIFRI